MAAFLPVRSILSSIAEKGIQSQLIKVRQCLSPNLYKNLRCQILLRNINELFNIWAIMQVQLHI